MARMELPKFHKKYYRLNDVIRQLQTNDTSTLEFQIIKTYVGAHSSWGFCTITNFSIHIKLADEKIIIIKITC